MVAAPRGERAAGIAPMRTRHDVVVVGGGHNGLTAACVLARSGLDVGVVEASASFGGQSITICPIASAPEHRINPYAVDDVFLTAGGLVDDLDLRKFGYRDRVIDPAWVYLHEGGSSLAFWRDPRRTADEIRAYSRSDADAYLSFIATVDKMLDFTLPLMKVNPHRPGLRTMAMVAGRAARHFRTIPTMSWFAVASAAQAICERFQHDIVRSALAQLAAVCVGPITVEGSAIGLLVAGFNHRLGTRRPIGGTQVLIDALLENFRAAGGTPTAGAAVEEILIANDRAIGVRLEDGAIIGARYGVIATCDPRQALGRLLPSGTLDQVTQARVDNIPTAGGGGSAFKVDLALSGTLSLERHQRLRTDGLDLRIPAGLIGSFESMVRASGQARAGQLPDDDNLFTVIPTAADSTQAPSGQDTLYLYAPVTPVEPTIPWETQSEKQADAIVATAAEYFDGVVGCEIGRYVQSPAEMAMRVNATLGATVTHVDFLPHRLGPLRPALGLGGYRTSVAGLYLGGSGSHPGFGMTGLPGRLSAKQLMRDIAGRRRDEATIGPRCR